MKTVTLLSRRRSVKFSIPARFQVPAPECGCLDWGIFRFSTFCPEEYWDIVLKQNMFASLHILYKSYSESNHTTYLNPRTQDFENRIGLFAQLCREVPFPFMECEVPLKCPKEPATRAYPEPHKLIPYHLTPRL